MIDKNDFTVFRKYEGDEKIVKSIQNRNLPNTISKTKD